MTRLLFGLVCIFACSSAFGSDGDRDGDGLSDFQETHKYFTDPDNSDSDGDGTADGDWNERREFSYTIRSVVKVMPPITESAMNNNYQDSRVIGSGDEFIEIEVIHYPKNTVLKSITDNADWRAQYASMKEGLQPGATTNWDQHMQEHLLAALRDGGIDVDELTDREFVLAASRWLMRRVGGLNSSAYAITFRDGGPAVIPEFKNKFRQIMHDKDGTVEDQFQVELYGRGMYYNKMTGSCTSAANYLTTCLRAAGVPARMVRAIPAVDASDPEQLRMVEANISDEQVRATMLKALRRLGKSFSAHTYNEVYVGNRWHRLNYDRLGQNILDEQFMGLMTHIHEYNDLAEAGIADTWGTWQIGTRRVEPFLHSNPYRTIEISDQVGEHVRDELD